MFKLLRNWFVVLVVMFILTYLWHNVIFGSQYPGHLAQIVRTANGAPAPLFSYFILAHVIAALGYVLYIPAVARTKSAFMWHGVVMGWVTFGFFAILSHALFANWTTWLMSMDLAFGTLAGAITGGILKRLV